MYDVHSMIIVLIINHQTKKLIIFCVSRFKPHLSMDVKRILPIFFLRILSILTHTHWKRGEGFKETNNDVYPK